MTEQQIPDRDKGRPTDNEKPDIPGDIHFR
jgi:hypothetical protein